MKTQKIIFTCICVFFLSSCNSYDDKYYLKEANIFLDKKDYQKAIDKYSKSIDINPRNYSAYYNRSIAFTYLNKLDLAISDLTMIEKLYPNDSTIFYNRAMLYFTLKKYKQALNDFTISISRKKINLTEHSYRAACYVFLNNYEEAIKDANYLIDRLYDSNSYNTRSAIYCSYGRSDLAIKDANMALTLNPNFANAYSNRGIAYKNLGLKDKAIADFKRAVDLGDQSGVEDLKRFYNIDYQIVKR